MGTAVWVAIIGGISAVVSAMVAFIIRLLEKKNKDEIINCIMDMNKEDRLLSHRMELMILINHYPHQVETIYEQYDKYKNMGGNSYMEVLVAEWEKKYVKKKKGAKK